MPDIRALANPTQRAGTIFTVARGNRRMILLAPLGREAREYMRAGDKLINTAPATNATFSAYGVRPMKRSAHLLVH